MSLRWEQDPKYPISQGTCSMCGIEGKIKLAFDLRQSICIRNKDCLERMKERRGTS